MSTQLFGDYDAVMQALSKRRFDRIVIDEAHFVKNLRTKRTQALYGEKVLATPAQRRQALLDHWSSRGCTEAGESVRKSVSTFLELEVNERGHLLQEVEHGHHVVRGGHGGLEGGDVAQLAPVAAERLPAHARVQGRGAGLGGGAPVPLHPRRHTRGGGH